MLKRNAAVKLAPQRWQENAADGIFDVVITFEEKVFDMVVEGNISCLFSLLFSWVHLIARCFKLSDFLNEISLSAIANFLFNFTLHCSLSSMLRLKLRFLSL
jgi:hypothetical protein